MNKAPANAAKRRAWRTGLWAEFLAAWLLRLKGFRILARRYRHPAGEIDIIARRGNLIVFAEVKARTTAGEALSAITPHQRRRIERAAESFAASAPGLQNSALRFDIVAVGSTGWPVHLSDAWRPEH